MTGGRAMRRLSSAVSTRALFTELVTVASRHRRPAVAIVLDLPLAVALERNATREAPRPPPGALRRQHRWLVDSLGTLPAEGFAAVHHLRSPEEIDAARLERAGR